MSVAKFQFRSIAYVWRLRAGSLQASERSRMIRFMRFPAWFMCVLVVCQLCLGSAWAHASFVRVGGLDMPLAGATEAGPAHCHEAAANDVSDRMEHTSSEHSVASCCSAAHCYLCSAAGAGSHALSLPAPAQAAWVSLPSIAMASQTQPPELRPPI